MDLETVEEVRLLAKKSRLGRFVDLLNEIQISSANAKTGVQLFRKLNNTTKNRRDKKLFLDLMHAFGTFV